MGIAVLSVHEGLTLHEVGTTTEVPEWSVRSFCGPPVAGWLLAGTVSLWIGIVVIWRRGNATAPDIDEI